MIKVNQHLESKQVITADLYKGSIIEKAYGGGDEGMISAHMIKTQLDNKLEKGIIDQLLYDKAIEQLDNIVKGGEGSKGGKIIGHTKSGKPIYDIKPGTSKKYKDFTKEDHLDAQRLHNSVNTKSGPQSEYSGYHHADMADSHSYMQHYKNRSIDPKLKKAYDILGLEYKEDNEQDSLEKASKGEGSKGGHVIGHTKSGKPVYKGKDQASSKEYKDFSAQDHKDASKIHADESYKHSDTFNTTSSPEHASYARAMQQHHVDASSSHAEAGSKLGKIEHESSISDTDKKILGDQNKKKIDHHNRMSDFHKTMLDSIKKYKEDKSTGYGSQATQDAIQEAEHHHTKQFEHHSRQASGDSDLVQLTRG